VNNTIGIALYVCTMVICTYAERKKTPNRWWAMRCGLGFGSVKGMIMIRDEGGEGQLIRARLNSPPVARGSGRRHSRHSAGSQSPGHASQRQWGRRVDRGGFGHLSNSTALPTSLPHEGLERRQELD
jgi:hypothetical protein